ncbi:Uncharacterized protein involved in outer membrane biogenesis [Robiginitalea myxolifaciens]|uniref:Uncharacterized protein involved in outer membrane biogenesis n=1 Tax=Robiginitalea myxolifaciens TaxID=400055 RepID=A0A1I6FSC0_9FLAO|nr:AsmA-like C-terminal region-containing protein [Robiginitalea myxolifaciens]SFR32852.1 Uncharacterized protein involved in outer membrane biogenesis [Robiginitalea myxolifaciens]
MKKKTKKRLKIAGIVLLAFFGLLAAIPLFLEAKIEPILKRSVNASINGNFDFGAARLSLIRSFPNVQVSLEDASITTLEPFAGDTLIAASKLELVMGLGELFKSEGEAIELRELRITGADLRLVSNSDEQVNYLIAKIDTAETESEPFTLSLQEYAIIDSRVSYVDLASRMAFLLEDIQHSGSGDLTLEQSELDTHTQGLISFGIEGVNYLDRNEVELDALLGIDLTTDTYTFQQSKGRINQMPLEVNGSVALIPEGQELDLRLSTPNSDFKNLLALVPQAYAGNLDGVTTSGEFTLEGTLKGINSEERIPDFELRMLADKAAFKYPELPMGVEEIAFDATLSNSSGQVEQTSLQLPFARFTLGGDRFEMRMDASELGGNPKVNAALKGVLDLANLARAYPMENTHGMRGKLRADVQTAFNWNAISARRYSETRSSGNLDLQDFTYASGALPSALQLQSARLRFDPQQAVLESLQGTLGQSDFKANGNLRNYIGYLLSDGTLLGQLNLESNRFVVADFQPPAAEEAETEAETFELPANLDISTGVKAETLVYDNLEMKQVNGTLRLKDQSLQLTNLQSNTLDGVLALSGAISAPGGKPRFDLDLGIEGFRIAQTLETIELFESLAPVASLLEGKFNTKLRLSGALNEDFSPDLTTLAGKAVAEVLSSGLSGKKGAVVSALGSRLDFFNAENLNLKGLKTVLAFENGLVAVEPFSFTYQDIKVNVTGGHTFDQRLDYTATFEVPAKYLGKEVNALLAEMDDPDLAAVAVPVVARIGGQYTNPEVSTDLKAAATDLTKRLVEIKKQRLIDGGKDKARKLLGDLVGQRKDSTADSTRTIQGGLRDLLKGVKGPGSGAGTGTEKPVDSTQTNSQANKPLEEKAKNILGGLLGRKKDTARSVKDSVKQ